ncbi:MAG: CBS domain-containing protein [Actinomycetota bacterium]
MTSVDHPEPHPALAAMPVSAAMSSPIQACAPDLELPAVARLMAERGIHCVAVVERAEAGGDGAFLGILSDLDLVEAADTSFDRRTAGHTAAEPLVSVPADAPLALAVRVMRENRAHHLVVVERGSGHPVGVLSTLDVARALASAAGRA